MEIPMKISQEGIDKLLKPNEGCKLKAYLCPAGKWTIGYGHTIAAGYPDVVEGMTITQKQADAILATDLIKYEAAVTNMVKVPLTQNQFDVLVDLAYNIGPGALKTSTLMKRVNAGSLNKVPEELLKWTRGGGKVLPGLVRRRQEEVVMWNEVDDDPEGARITPDVVPARTMAQSKQGNAAIVAGGLAAVGAAKDVVNQVQEASDTTSQIVTLVQNTNFIVMVAIVLIGGAIWYWRKQNMEKDGA